MRRVLGVIFFGCLLASSASAQLSPTGSHYAGRASDTGHQSVTATGGFPASVALDFPAARGGIGIPVSLTHGRRGFGAGGLGWDVPLSFVRRDDTVSRRRPARLPGQNVQPRERVIVSVGGRTVEMVRSGDVWLARRDAPDWELREVPDSFGGTWRLRDGSGQELVFSAPSALIRSNLWLLSSATSTTASNHLELEYQVLQRAFTGGSGVEIDLVSVKYNTHPNTPGCVKNEISLDYNDVSSEPQSISLLGDLPVVRMGKIWQIRVLARESCAANAVTLRRYLLDYVDDPDTQQKRLSGVRVFGRDGTAEASVALPLASYGYGAATSNGKLAFERGTDITFPAEVGSTPPLARTYCNPGASSPDGGKTYVGWQNMLDISGDGRPDLVFKQSGQLRVAINRPAGTGATTFTANSTLPLSDPVYSGRPLTSYSSESIRYGYAWQNHNHLWRQTIDVNGDGRLDIIDASEEDGVWTIYLNTPGNPVRWVKRKFRVDGLRKELQRHGHVIEGGRVPLARRTTGHDLEMSECWKWDESVQHYVPDPSGFQDGHCPADQIVDQHTVGDEKTYTEWEVRDVNGDGYPDVVFNSSPVRNIEFEPCPVDSLATDPPGPYGCTNYGEYWVFVPREPLQPTAGADNAIMAMLNVVGVMFVDDNPFSSPVTLAERVACGVGLWQAPEGDSLLPPGRRPDRQFQQCGIEDVNGDGTVDRIEGTAVHLGNGDSFDATDVRLQLPDVAEQQNQHPNECTGNPATVYEPQQRAGLRDLTGDGIPDFINSDEGWKVWIGTGAGFKPPVPIDIKSAVGFAISNTQEACAGNDANTMGGLYDIDGDGKPELVEVVHNPLHIEVYHLAGEAPGNPHAGRLASIDNGYGAVTRITYRSAKEDGATSHQVPFPEIVVTAVETIGTNGLGGTLSAVRYAYGDAEQFFDPLLDAFTMRAYGRTIEVHGTGREDWDADFAIARETYRLTPFSPPLSEAARFDRYQKVGRVRDTYVLGFGVERDPWEVLRTFAPYTDSRRVAGTHQDWVTQYVPLPEYTSSFDCMLVDDPYDWNPVWLGDESCGVRGFSYVQASESWRGTQAPGSSASNVETRFEVLSVDDVGNVLELRNENDRHDANDDVCMKMEYAKQAAEARILSALSTRRVTNCMGGAKTRTLSFESWELDELPVGDVGLGRVTSRTTEVHATDDGQYLDTIRDYEIGYDRVGNPSYIVTAREDGAVRSVELFYDEFDLAPRTITVDASGLDPFTTEASLDPLTLSALSQRDVNGTTWGTEIDGFGRAVRSTVELPNGSFGVVSTTSYDGFSSPNAAGRSIHTKVFRNPVPPDAVDTTRGDERIAWFDELGRPRRAEKILGEDYGNESLVVLLRAYDGMGRVSFEADPHAKSQNSTTAYGTSYHFDTHGELACSIRGHGPQPLTFTTDLTAELFPTCITRTFSNYQLQTAVSTPDSLDAGTPQAGTLRTDTSTAIGRLLSRETWRNGTRLELSTYEYDRSSQLAKLTRFGDPGASPQPIESVAWTWRHDSLGRTIYATEPQVAARSFIYSDWGESLAVHWTDASGISFAVEQSYDALGRLAHSLQRRAGQVIPESEYDWTYDTAETTPLLTPTFTAGRLTKTHSVIGDMHVGYDAFGNVNARAFTEKGTDWYGEKHELHADGAPSALELQLPDTSYATERYEYQYDSASRLRSVIYKAPSGDTSLYASNEIDAWGRVRSATYGASTSYGAKYADAGRRMLLEETITLPTGAYRRVQYTKHDAAGRELERSEVNPEKITTLSVYDALGRLVRSVDGLHGQSFDRRFTYDALGNLRQSVDLVTSEQTNVTFSPLDRDRICRIDYGAAVNGPCNVDHDDSGNIVGQPAPGEKYGDPPSHRTLQFYPSGAVSTIEQDKTTVANFLYDGSGQIFALDVSGPFLRDARRDRRFGLVEHREVDIDGEPQSIIERHIPGPGGIVASRRGAGESFIYPFGDNRGTRTATNGSAFVQDVTYQPFGKATSSGAKPRSLEHVHHQWNGGDALADLGLVHLGARLYDPNIGRFLSRDPLIVQRSASAMNPYGFALNDPINFADPTGMCTESPDGSGCESLPITIPSLGGLNDSSSQPVVRIIRGPELLPNDEDVQALGISYVYQAPLYTFPEGTLGSDDDDFMSRLTNTQRGIDVYDPADVMYSGTPIVAWMYGDPTQDIGTLPPWRVMARVAFEYVLSGAGIRIPVRPTVFPGMSAALRESVGLGLSAAPKSALLTRYLAGSGGRWGNQATRLLNHEIATQLEREGYSIAGGAGRASEEWIRPDVGGLTGGTFVDITATNGSRTIRVQTVDVTASGTPTPREAAAIRRILARYPNDELQVVPKPRRR